MNSLLNSFLRAVTVVAAMVTIYVISAPDTAGRWQRLAELTGFRLPPAQYDPRSARTGIGFSGSRATAISNGALPHDLLIGQGAGQRVTRLSADGEVVWTRKTGARLVGLEVFGAIVIAGLYEAIVAYDLETGTEVWRHEQEIPLAGIGRSEDGIIILPYSQIVPLAFASVSHETSKLGDAEFRHLEFRPNLARHAVETDSNIMIANTFDLRVHDITTQQRPGLQVYYPSQIQMLDHDRIAVADEHGNRISIWNRSTDQLEILVGCNAPLYTDSTATPDIIRQREAETWLGTMSACDARADKEALLSPNGFHIVDDMIYVADTDNHRIAVFDLNQRRLIGEVTGLNAPVRVIGLDGRTGQTD
ncbi:MAG: hypothetical protein AAGF33_05430 [Pseudomonadota bacterium]